MPNKEYIALLNDVNDTNQELYRIGCESIEMVHATERYHELKQLIQSHNQIANDWPELNFTGNEVFGIPSGLAASMGLTPKTLALIGVGIVGFLGVNSYVTYATQKWIQHILKFSTKAKKAVDYFETNIKPFKNHITESEFLAKKAKLLTTQQFQELSKTVKTLEQLITKSFNDIKTTPIEVKDIQLNGLSVKTKTDKNNITTITEIKVEDIFKPKKNDYRSRRLGLNKAVSNLCCCKIAFSHPGFVQ